MAVPFSPVTALAAPGNERIAVTADERMTEERILLGLSERVSLK